MADNKSKRGKSDRSKVAAGQDYEVSDLAEQLGMSQKRIREAIAIVGNRRADIVKFLKAHGA